MKQNSEKKNFLHKADRQHITAVGGDFPVLFMRLAIVKRIE